MNKIEEELFNRYEETMTENEKLNMNVVLQSIENTNGIIMEKTGIDLGLASVTRKIYLSAFMAGRKSMIKD